ncbi:MAG: hypothetical protein IJO59_02205 [Clostridia bacterium]|nr:hypothetical protein [Clostridia bacterium]
MEKRKKINVQAEAETLQKQGRGSIVSDILGSYTGTGQNGESPEQDADDL